MSVRTASRARRLLRWASTSLAARARLVDRMELDLALAERLNRDESSQEAEAIARRTALAAESHHLSGHAIEAWRQVARANVHQARPDSALAAYARGMEVWGPRRPGVPMA
jgi:hypothetical protein